MSEEDMQRTLASEFGGLGFTYNPLTGLFVMPPGSPYQQLTPGVFLQQQDIDLTGYALERKTFYPYSSFEQKGGTTSARFIAAPTTQPYMAEFIIVSSVPLSNNDLFASIATAPGFNMPNLPLAVGRFNRAQIIHGSAKWYTVDNTMSVAGGYNTLRLIDTYNFSSLEPTAADKLYCYRLVTVTSVPGETLNASIPPARVILPGSISSEPKLEYMMRLKRSYELANQV